MSDQVTETRRALATADEFRAAWRAFWFCGFIGKDNPGGSTNAARCSRLRGPRTGESTVMHRALHPAAWARWMVSRLIPRSDCTYNWNQSGEVATRAISSIDTVALELTTNTALAAPAPRAVASSPSECTSF